jgi:predicted nuclease of predicted toxin-antitoxin system
MRLLFDEQLSERLVRLFGDVYPDSRHVTHVVGEGAPDEAVWRAAVEHRCALVTRDEDFHRLSVLRGAPPKVIWLRIGNCTSSEVARLLRVHRETVRAFLDQSDATVLELGAPPALR